MVFRDLFATEYLADPDNAENTKAVDILKAWNVLPTLLALDYFADIKILAKFSAHC